MGKNETRELAEKLVRAAARSGKTISLAESCTGGKLAAAITDVAGSSAVFCGSAVTYSNEAKESILGVHGDIIEKHGAVSRECALDMARGARAIYGADIALSITGIAGPGGGTWEKPVGTVWLACSSDAKEEAFVCCFSGDRGDIRSAAVRTALEYLLKEV